MLGIILKILSVSGILLLILLGIALLLLLLILFFPITYRAYGRKDAETASLSVKANWLFGLIRVRYAYPVPGKLIVKFLMHTLFDSGAPKQVKTAAQKEAAAEKQEGQNDTVKAEQTAGESKNKSDRTTDADTPAELTEKEITEEGVLFQKVNKIKYTINHIYGKIKEIWENINYYIELLQEEETKQLFSRICFRLIKILKHIRPRHLSAEALFGTGSPDTTGYLLGIYGMISPSLGSSVNITPDFTEKKLEGTFSLSGHITVIILLINVCKVLLDKKLMNFINKWKAGRK